MLYWILLIKLSLVSSNKMIFGFSFDDRAHAIVNPVLGFATHLMPYHDVDIVFIELLA